MAAKAKTPAEAKTGPGNIPGNKKVKIQINKVHYDVDEGETSVVALRALANIPEIDVLAKKERGTFVDLANDATVAVHNGDKFASHKPATVLITINGEEFETTPGANTVAQLRSLGHVPADEILSQFVSGQFVDLANDATVNIKGGEIFASHRPTGGSS